MSVYHRRSSLLSLVTSYEDCDVKISKKDYLHITEEFMKFIASKILNGDSVVLPAGLGTLGIIGRKPKIKIEENTIKGLSPDWKKTKELWETDEVAKKEKKVLYFFNEHTGGVRYKYGWAKWAVRLRNKHLFYFRASRENKRNVWKKIMEGKEYYLLNN